MRPRHQYTACDTTQHRAMRTVLGVGKCTPIPALYGDLQWISPHIRHQLSVVRYWCRLIRMPQSRLPRRVFEWDYRLASRGRRSWNREVRGILAKCGIVELFERDQWHTINVYDLTTQLRRALILQQQQQRTADASTMSRMAVYNELVDYEHHVPDYVNKLSRERRSVIAKLRMGTLPLMLEKGRYINKPRHERLCINCVDNVVETEAHFIFHCSKYNTLRESIYHDHEKTDTDNFIAIFSDSQRTKQLAQFIIEAMRKRT